jgi:hypothetical protein
MGRSKVLGLGLCRKTKINFVRIVKICIFARSDADFICVLLDADYPLADAETQDATDADY